MADLADLADARIEQHLADALTRQVGKSAPETHPDFDGERCIQCNETIPLARLSLHKIRCVQCQSALESARARGLV